MLKLQPCYPFYSEKEIIKQIVFLDWSEIEFVYQYIKPHPKGLVFSPQFDLPFMFIGKK